MSTAPSGGSLIGKIGSYLQIVAKDPSSTAFVPLAEAYRQIGLLDDALEAARLGTRMLPHFSPGFSTMGRILGQMGRIDESMSAYARALSLDRQSQSALVGLARLHLIRGERDQARRILTQAKDFHPDDQKISDMLTALDLPRPWEQIKQAPQIQDAAEPANEHDGEGGEPIPTATLAEIYIKQGLHEKALGIYHDILAKDPENQTVQERIRQLRTQLGVDESPAAETVPVASETAPSAVAADSPHTEEPKDQSPLAVMQRWLSVIQKRRVNV